MSYYYPPPLEVSRPEPSFYRKVVTRDEKRLKGREQRWNACEIYTPTYLNTKLEGALTHNQRHARRSGRNSPTDAVVKTEPVIKSEMKESEDPFQGFHQSISPRSLSTPALTSSATATEEIFLSSSPRFFTTPAVKLEVKQECTHRPILPVDRTPIDVDALPVFRSLLADDTAIEREEKELEAAQTLMQMGKAQASGAKPPPNPYPPGPNFVKAKPKLPLHPHGSGTIRDPYNKIFDELPQDPGFGPVKAVKQERARW